MTAHKNDKGIIHTTSYKQVDFIIENISPINRHRLLRTDPNIPREEVIAEHIHSAKPTVLISPSLYLGLDLKDDLSRFQIITKVPYPDLGDRLTQNLMKSVLFNHLDTSLEMPMSFAKHQRSVVEHSWLQKDLQRHALTPCI